MRYREGGIGHIDPNAVSGNENQAGDDSEDGFAEDFEDSQEGEMVETADSVQSGEGDSEDEGAAVDGSDDEEVEDEMSAGDVSSGESDSGGSDDDSESGGENSSASGDDL